MKAAPIQLSQISFRRVSVEMDAARIPADGTPPSDVAFDFDKVTVQTHVSFTPVPEVKEPGSSFFLTLRVVVDNEPTDDTEARFSPYLVDIEAGAQVRAIPGSEVLGDVEDLVVVNGTSLLWSAVRELVCTLTARMPAGLVMLPTVNFHDLKQEQRKASQAEQLPDSGTRKPPAAVGEKRRAPRRPV